MSKNLTGNSIPDKPLPIDKNVVITLIQNQIKKLESYESTIMSQNLLSEDSDTEFDEDRIRLEVLFSNNHVSNATAIMELKMLLKKINDL